MKKFGLIGKTLSHSFSKNYFGDKFEKENITDAQYDLYELADCKELFNLISENKQDLRGLNVTIPYKQDVLPYLKEIDPAAKKIGAVNVLKINTNGEIKGYNSDYYGFLTSLEEFAGEALTTCKALILGTGGASKAVKQALIDLNIPFQYVSRQKGENILSYDELTPEIIKEHQLIINSTPLGMYPKVDTCPTIPYEAISSNHFLYDLVYNPEETLFMKKGREQGAKAIHGLQMLILQAEKSWEIWNS
jgi:shikimate dehydrogenase